MRNTHTALVVGLVALTLARLAVAASFPLVDDEAYYWVWSRQLAWGYPDHPPIIAGLVRLTTAVAGDTPLGVRFGPVVIALVTSLLLFDLTRRMFNQAAGVVAALWYQLIPAVAIGSLFAFPDAPFMLFWTLTLWCLWQARTTGRRVYWYGTGLALGLALASKLSALFLALSIGGYLLASAGERRWLRRPEPFHAAAIALAVFFPVIAWNADHKWITFWRAREPIPWVQLPSPGLNALAFTLSQLAYFGPISCVLLWLVLAEHLRRNRLADPRFAFTAWAALPILGLTWLLSFDGLPKPHWTAPAYVIALIPAAAFWFTVRTRAWWRVTIGAAVLLNAVLVVALHVLPFWRTSSVAGQVWGWDSVAVRVVREVESTQSSPGVFILTSAYQTASQIEFHTRGRYLVTTPYGGDAFGARTHPQSLIDWNAIYISDLAAGPGIPLFHMFRRVDPLAPIDVVLEGTRVRRFYLYRGYEFRGLPRPPVRPI